MRTFVAIDLPPEIRTELARIQSLFRAALGSPSGADGSVRWTDISGTHLTLKFLGEVAERKLQAVIERLQEIGPFEKFDVVVRGFGVFPNPREPRVFWAGVEPSLALEALRRRVDESLAEIGFDREQRSYTPHLTLARFTVPQSLPALRAMLDSQGKQLVGRFRVSEFFLFESRLSPGRPAEYLQVARFP
ncbi:MAG: RNA 2',3'-cyclic phosphodiesterase [Terriglobia bacterium]